MKHLIYTMVISAALLPVVSCEKTPQTKVASRFELSLGTYTNENGESVKHKWNAEDEVGIIRVASEHTEATVASPLMPGRYEGLFMPSWEGYEKDAEIVAYYPSSASVSYENGIPNAPVPEIQDGSFRNVFIGTGKSNGSSYLEAPMTLEPWWHNLYISLRKGDYVISKAEFKSQEQNVTIKFAAALDCSKKSEKLFISLPSITLENGYTITFTTTDDRSFDVRSNRKTVLEQGEMTIIREASFPQELIVCGDNMIYIIDADRAENEGFEDAVTWSWDATTVASVVGGDMTRLDDCKCVDNGTKILATSSRSWAVLIDIATKELLWWTYSSKNAHSAEWLPEGRIAVACSGGETGNRVQIFDTDTPDTVLSYVELESAHGVVWSDKTRRLYAVGQSKLNVYELTDWNTDSPKLTLEKSIDTSDNVTGVHDLTLINDDYLLLAGRKAALYNMSTEQFTSLPHFNGSTALKSVNYNMTSGDCWYTDTTVPAYEAPYDWASDTIFHTSNVAGNTVDKRISIPEGYHMYKVRVKSW